MTMRNIARAFAHCADCYENCPAYRAIAAEESKHEPEEVPAVARAAAS